MKAHNPQYGSLERYFEEAEIEKYCKTPIDKIQILLRDNFKILTVLVCSPFQAENMGKLRTFIRNRLKTELQAPF